MPVEKSEVKNKFELVVLAGARARQPPRGVEIEGLESSRGLPPSKSSRDTFGRSKRRTMLGEKLVSLIALGVTGGIGAYKAVEVARGLQKRGHDVAAVMTSLSAAVRR